MIKECLLTSVAFGKLCLHFLSLLCLVTGSVCLIRVSIVALHPCFSLMNIRSSDVL